MTNHCFDCNDWGCDGFPPAAPLDVERAIQIIEQGERDKTLLVRAYAYPDGDPNNGIALTPRGLLDRLSDGKESE